MIARKLQFDSLGLSQLLGCCLFWAFQQVLVKATLPKLAPVFQASIRFADATLIFWLQCTSRSVKLCAADGSLSAGLLAGSLFAAEFTFVTPLFVLLFGALWLNEAGTLIPEQQS